VFHAYPSEVSTGTLFREFSRNSLSFFKDINLTDQTLVHVFFNDLISTHYRKDMYQNWLGVLAAFGGERERERVKMNREHTLFSRHCIFRFVGSIFRIFTRHRIRIDLLLHPADVVR
jgi:hypothetical protein